MARNVFIDPAGVRADYPWTINHSTENEVGKTRTVEHGAKTGTGLVRQQSDSTPLVLRFSGTILHKAQVIEMKEWWQLCEEQTIYFRDFAGDEYEVLITSFRPTRHRTIRNPRDPANALYWFWRYELEMEVITIREGVWEGVTP